jgi:hypothetical protein
VDFHGFEERRCVTCWGGQELREAELEGAVLEDPGTELMLGGIGSCFERRGERERSRDPSPKRLDRKNVV